MRSLWREAKNIPLGCAAVLDALRLDGRSFGLLSSLTDKQWDEALSFADRAQLTLLLARDMGAFPRRVRERLGRNVIDNGSHNERVRAAWLEIADSLSTAGVEFVLLKGFTHTPNYLPDRRLRVQYDIDLYCRPEDVVRARDRILELGYVSPPGSGRRPMDHLPVLVRYTDGWRWCGDYFDPAMPQAVDLHFRFWDPGTERFDAPGTKQFWERRAPVEIDGLSVPALDLADDLGYAALHALRHWLRGSLKAFHICELACFLDSHEHSDAFWTHWRGVHSHEMRRLEALPFRLAVEWFACRVPAAVADEIELLPPEVSSWFERFAASPVETLFHPNKAELLLHWLLLDSWRDKLAVARRRLLPAVPPSSPEAPATPAEKGPRWFAARAGAALQIGRRTAYHAAAAVRMGGQVLAWNSRAARLGREFWKFLSAACLFNFGMFVFLVIYNLRLLDLGYRENVLGWIAGAMTAGSIVGTLPAGAALQRLGVRKALLACIGSVGVLSALRTMATGPPLLVATAFLSGVCLSLWAVSVPPAVARLTSERDRTYGFSAVFSAGITMGIFGGLAAGRLSALFGKKAGLLAGCAAMLLALLPAARLSIADAAGARRAIEYPRTRFTRRYLGVLALWSFAVGAFNPFFSAYFARLLHASAEWIGFAFSASQLAQVGALLIAPVVLRTLGVTRGIMAMQLAAGLALAWLSRGPELRAAGLAYAAYTSFQYMSEPGLYTLLMGNVRAEQQTGASSLNFFVAFAAQAAAAALAGTALTRVGYPTVMLGAAMLALIAALLFGVLMRPFGKPVPR